MNTNQSKRVILALTTNRDENERFIVINVSFHFDAVGAPFLMSPILPKPPTLAQTFVFFDASENQKNVPCKISQIKAGAHAWL